MLSLTERHICVFLLERSTLSLKCLGISFVEAVKTLVFRSNVFFKIRFFVGLDQTGFKEPFKTAASYVLFRHLQDI
jgi:hypothetical protein